MGKRGSNDFIAKLGTRQTMTPGDDHRGLLQDRGARDRADDPIGITASEAQLKIRPDMMVEPHHR